MSYVQFPWPLRAIAYTSQFRSFYLEPVYRLVPIFSPFLTATLLVSLVVVEVPSFISLTYTSAFQSFLSLRLSLGRLCHPERALGNATFCALSNRAQPH